MPRKKTLGKNQQPMPLGAEPGDEEPSPTRRTAGPYPSKQGALDPPQPFRPQVGRGRENPQALPFEARAGAPRVVEDVDPLLVRHQVLEVVQPRGAPRKDVRQGHDLAAPGDEPDGHRPLPLLEPGPLHLEDRRHVGLGSPQDEHVRHQGQEVEEGRDHGGEGRDSEHGDHRTGQGAHAQCLSCSRARVHRSGHPGADVGPRLLPLHSCRM